MPDLEASARGWREDRAAERGDHGSIAADVVRMPVGRQNAHAGRLQRSNRLDGQLRVNRVDQQRIAVALDQVEDVVADARGKDVNVHEEDLSTGEDAAGEPVSAEARPWMEGIPWEERFVVERNYHGWRLDRYLTDKLHRATRTQVSQIARQGMWYDGRWVRKGGVTVRAGAEIRIPRVEFADPATPPLSDITVLHRSGTVIVVDKPAGMLVHRTAHEATRTIEAWTATAFGDERVESVHRLDRETAGCLVCGVGFEAIRDLRTLFSGVEVQKRYAAIVEDPGQRWNPGDEREIDIPLGLDASSRVGIRMGPGDLGCRTFARCRSRAGTAALLDVEIEQGRQHQIRVHLALTGTPVVGDKLYAMGDDYFLRWINAPGRPDLVEQLATRWHCLACVGVEFSHAGRRHRVELPIPRHMNELLAARQP
jgi:23S rRNA pseudouridine1911/1915/1917 synthase